MNLKEEIHQKALQIALDKINSIRKAIDSQQEAANNETKSSSGDKYETGRAMAHFEQEKLSKQLQVTEKNAALISSIKPSKVCSIVEFGSLILTNQGKFYLSAALGEVDSKEHKVHCISTSAPLAQAFLSKKANDTIVFNQKSFKILELY